jgi:hypothetical protein
MTISNIGSAEFPRWQGAFLQKLNIIPYKGRKPNTPNGFNMQA